MKRAAPGCDIHPRKEKTLIKEEQPMKKIAYVGIDYHLNSLSIAFIVRRKKKVHETVRIKNDDKIICK
jgi:hypothetical protein